MKCLAVHQDNRKTLQIEARRQVYEARDKLFNDMDSVILWVLHESFGFGKDRLRKFYNEFQRLYTDLQNHYELGNDTPYVCIERLKQIGVNIEEWEENK